MSTEFDDGGPAGVVVSDGCTHGTHTGKSLRDYFAAHAPITLSDARSALLKRNGLGAHQSAAEEITELALMRMEYADAMIQARKVRP